MTRRSPSFSVFAGFTRSNRSQATGLTVEWAAKSVFFLAEGFTPVMIYGRGKSWKGTP